MSPPTTMPCVLLRYLVSHLFPRRFGLVLRSNAISPLSPFTIYLLYLHCIVPQFVPHTSFSYCTFLITPALGPVFLLCTTTFCTGIAPFKVDHLTSDLPCCPSVFVPARLVELLLHPPIPSALQSHLTTLDVNKASVLRY
ncbi:hypothetical protein BJV78DRAFT_160804 [Lactifluus subvellereus]|nr:hypothetical protein BJV78DRAFT_160804 [Lactifluus subvellereus]